MLMGFVGGKMNEYLELFSKNFIGMLCGLGCYTYYTWFPYFSNDINLIVGFFISSLIGFYLGGVDNE